MAWVYLAVAIVAEVIATSAMKYSDGFSRVLPTMVVFLGYGIAFYCMSITIKEVPLAVVYAIWSGTGIALITIVAWVLFGQKLNVAGLIGIALIASGVVLLNLSVKAH